MDWRTAGLLLTKQGNPIFPSTLNATPVTDYFNQLFNGDFGPDWYTLPGGPGPFTLQSYSVTNPALVTSPCDGGPVLHSAPDDDGVHPLGEGAFVQNLPSIGSQVNDVVTNTLPYDAWKAFALERGLYLRPSTNGFTNQAGELLYVNTSGVVTPDADGHTTLTSVAQLSMISLLPESRESGSLPDRLLFVDTIEGTSTGTKVQLQLTSIDPFFWKGLIYLNCDLKISGSGSMPTVVARNPAQAAGALSGSHFLSECFLDGVLCISGTLDTVGAPRVYGAVVSPDSSTFDNGAIPEIFYNSRLKQEVRVSSAPVPVTLSRFALD